jgi:hypothetical protein
MVRLIGVTIVAVLAPAGLAASAGASTLIGRNAQNVRLGVSQKGVALVSYRAAGKRVSVQAWGAINARTPSPTQRQVDFKLRYGAPARFHNVCRRYDGPKLSMLVTACTAPDGSWWALQSWQRGLPDFGRTPTAGQAAWELRLSHFHGPLAELLVWRDWVGGAHVPGLYGKLFYAGYPVYGFRSTPAGVPLDGYGRNLFLDTFNSAYGHGWRRENSFLAHRSSGIFCYAFNPTRTPERRVAVAGIGKRYRLTVIGPGVTPDMRWAVDGLPSFNPSDTYDVAFDRATNEHRASLLAQDPTCHI